MDTGEIKRRLLEQLNKESRFTIVAFSVALVIARGLLEYHIRDLSFLVIDLIPIFLCTWYAGFRSGVAVAFLSSMFWVITCVLATPAHVCPINHPWNAFIRFLFLAGVVYIVAELKRSLEREKVHARTDYLTSVLNSRAFLDLIGVESDRTKRYKRPISLAYLDIDNFKAVNDRFGHSRGDALLHSLSEIIKRNIRTSDTVGRLGGDEFGILLPETGSVGAYIVINRLNAILLDSMEKSRLPVTFSFGIVSYSAPPDTVEEMLRKADELMYLAKLSGKNVIKCQSFEVPVARPPEPKK